MRLKVSLYVLLSGDLAKVDARDLLLNHVGIRDALRGGLKLQGITHETHPAIVCQDGYLRVLPSRRTLERVAEKYPDLSVVQKFIRTTAVAGAVQAGLLDGSNSEPTWENVLYQDGTALRPATSNTIPLSIDQHGEIRDLRTCDRIGEFTEGGDSVPHKGVKIVMTHLRKASYKASLITGLDFLDNPAPEVEAQQAVDLSFAFLDDLQKVQPKARALGIVSDGAGGGAVHRNLSERGMTWINVPPPLKAHTDELTGERVRDREYEYLLNLDGLGVRRPNSLKGELVFMGGVPYEKRVADGSVEHRRLESRPRFTNPRGKRTYLYLEIATGSTTADIIRIPMHQAPNETPEEHQNRMHWTRAYAPGTPEYLALRGVRQSAESEHSSLDRKLPFKVLPTFRAHSQNWHVGMHAVFHNLRAQYFL